MGPEQPSWFESLKRLVSMRVAGMAVPRELVARLLRAVINDFDCTTDGHGINWNAEAWQSGFATYGTDSDREQLDTLAAGLPHVHNRHQGWRLITRRDVFAIGEPLTLFLAAMAWGFGPRGYGWRRTIDILTVAGDDAVVNAVRALQDANKNGGPEGVWQAFSDNHAAKLHGLGTAFASKVAYFACYDRRRDNGPLIADRNTAWAFWAIEDVWDIRASAARYGRYVTTATAWAGSLGSRSDDVERALFVLGPHVRAIYRQPS
jgi:hypothetical protein